MAASVDLLCVKNDLYDEVPRGDYAYNEEFEEVADKVELCALPAAIRNAYRRVIGKYRPQEDGE